MYQYITKSSKKEGRRAISFYVFYCFNRSEFVSVMSSILLLIANSSTCNKYRENNKLNCCRHSRKLLLNLNQHRPSLPFIFLIISFYKVAYHGNTRNGSLINIIFMANYGRYYGNYSLLLWKRFAVTMETIRHYYGNNSQVETSRKFHGTLFFISIEYYSDLEYFIDDWKMVFIGNNS